LPGASLFIVVTVDMTLKCQSWDWCSRKLVKVLFSTLVLMLFQGLCSVGSADEHLNVYGKIYEQTFTGSMVGNGSNVFAVWAYIIAHTKPDSMVELNPVLLSTILGDSINHVQAAIEILKTPDPESRSKSYDGRRLIEKGPFLYFVPNYLKYHGIPNDASRRQYFAEKQREHRERVKAGQTAASKMSKNVKQSESESKSKASTSPSGEDFISALKNNPAYKGIDIDREIGKMKAWLSLPKAKGRKLTKAFVVNWLNKIDIPISSVGDKVQMRVDHTWEGKLRKMEEDAKR
jgi:hypothetical protein